MTKPPPPEGYRDWCEWFIEHSDCNDFKSLRRAGFKDTDNIRVPTWAGADYDALEAEAEKLRAEVERLRQENAELRSDISLLMAERDSLDAENEHLRRESPQ